MGGVLAAAADESGDGSHCGMGDACNSGSAGFRAGAVGGGRAGAPRGEQTIVAGCCGGMSDFSASEGGNAVEIEKAAGEGGLDTDQDAVIEEHEESGDATSAQSTGKMDSQAPGWTKRVRVGKHPPDRMPCPDRVGMLEQTIRCYADKLGEHVVEPVIGFTFDSLDEAYDFYNLYSWEHGFGIRYGKSRLNTEKTKCMQEVVCGCSGKPIRENNMSCKCECPAMIRLLRMHDSGWYITEHRANHNHSLTTTCGDKVNWPSHKHIDVYTKDLVKQLRQNNVNVTKLYIIIASFFGDVDKIPFMKRTLRNLCGKINKQKAEDDVRKTIDAFAEIVVKGLEFV